VCTLGLASLSHAQMGGGLGLGGGIGGIPGTPYGGALDPSSIQLKAGFHIIPSIAAAQRYDSNVFFRQKIPGQDRSDYVTTVAPQVRMIYVGDAMRVNSTVGANAEYFAKNTDFSYVGANGALALDLSPTVSKLWRGMTFQIVDTFRYTPEPPSFLVGNQDSAAQNLFARGQQVGRVSITSNILSATASAPISQTVSLTGGYTYGFLQFGDSKVQQNGPLLNSSYHSFTGGVSTQVTPLDSITVSYLETRYDYGAAAGGLLTVRGGTLGWTHAFSPAVTLNSFAGAQVRTGGIGGGGATGSPTSVSVTSPGSQIVPTGGLTLTWSDQATTLSLLYTASLVPSYQFQAQPLLTNIVSLSVVQKTLIPQLVGLLSINYGRGDEFGSTSSAPISYESYGATGGVVYEFTQQAFLNLNYTYSHYNSQVGEQGFVFARNLVSITLAKAFY